MWIILDHEVPILAKPIAKDNHDLQEISHSWGTTMDKSNA